MRQVVCFDLWNTLIASSENNSYLDWLRQRGADWEKIYPFVRERLMVEKFSYAEMVKKLDEQFNLVLREDEREELIARWKKDNEQAMWLPGRLDWLHEWRERQASLVLVTNLTWPSWQAVSAGLSLEKYFDYLFLSCVEGVSKPNQRVWRKIEEIFCDQPSEFWMIGDSLVDDLAIPQIRGWKTIQV